MATLQGLDPAVLQAELGMAAANNQINVAINLTVVAMVGARAAVSPAAPPPSVLDPAEMRNLMTGGAIMPTRPGNGAQPAVASNGQGRITFSLQEDPVVRRFLKSRESRIGCRKTKTS